MHTAEHFPGDIFPSKHQLCCEIMKNKTAYHVHVRELTVIDSVLMYGLLLVGQWSGQMWPHYTLRR